MSSHHKHHSHDDHSHGSLSENEKLIKMIEHWIHHNHDHAGSYRDWARRAKDLGYEEVFRILQSVADDTVVQNENMEKALQLMRGSRASH